MPALLRLRITSRIVGRPLSSGGSELRPYRRGPRSRTRLDETTTSYSGPAAFSSADSSCRSTASTVAALRLFGRNSEVDRAGLRCGRTTSCKCNHFRLQGRSTHPARPSATVGSPTVSSTSAKIRPAAANKFRRGTPRQSPTSGPRPGRGSRSWRQTSVCSSSSRPRPSSITGRARGPGPRPAPAERLATAGRRSSAGFASPSAARRAELVVDGLGGLPPAELQGVGAGIDVDAPTGSRNRPLRANQGCHKRLAAHLSGGPTTRYEYEMATGGLVVVLLPRLSLKPPLLATLPVPSSHVDGAAVDAEFDGFRR